MAYNLQCLIRILEQILHPDQKRWILDHKKPKIESLLKKASSLKQILENSSPPSGQGIEGFEAQIRDAAHKAEDIIESHIVHQMLLKPSGGRFAFSPPDLQQVIEQLDSAMDKAMKITNGSQKPNSSSPAGASFRPDPSSKNIVVGLDKDLLQMKDRLTGEPRKLDIIPIVGTGGIGKTTLALNLYNDKLIFESFETCAWITISQDYNVRDILLGLLRCMFGKLTDDHLHQNEYQLGEIVYKELWGRKYLVVLDDIWSSIAWDDIKKWFPDNNNGSRIMLTTRQSDIVDVDSSRPDAQHQMHFLNESDSWKLLQQKVFGEEIECPAELERIGKKIGLNCRGLPLAVGVIGGLLSKAKRTKESWRHVEKDVRSVLSEEDKDFSAILSLSYNYLPDHLKPCFLYMGAFPENYEVRASKLTRLWMAEGFIKSIEYKSLEEAAASYLEALVSRNLILVRQKDSHGKAKSYSIHNCLRDLCIRKANQEKFLCARNQKAWEGPFADSLRRVSDPSFCLHIEKESKPLTRSFLCIGRRASREILSPVIFALTLLRVLDVFDIEFHQFPTEILRLVNLRYLAFSCNTDIPPAISRLWNLQTLIVGSNKGYIDMPTQIWEMSELIHVNLKKTVIWIEPGYWRTLVQEKLQMISTTNLYGLLQSGFLRSVPNIKKLGICFDFSPTSVVDLHHLHKLETLKLLGNFQSKLKFPVSIRRLTLSECFLPRTFMTTVGLLPNLEVLKIQKCDFQVQEMQPTDAVWEPTSGGFCSLRFLLLEKLNLVRWLADKAHFPALRHLVIRGCSALEEIPYGIGDIDTLEIIDLDESSQSALASAKQIQDEQFQLYCKYIKVRIHSSK